MVSENTPSNSMHHFTIPNHEFSNEYSFPAPGFGMSFNHHHHHFSSILSYNWNESNTGFPAMIGSSRYLKAAQSLLQEMASIGGKEIEVSNQKLVKKISQSWPKGFYGLSTRIKPEFSNSELLVKLLAMLEELQTRYEEYYSRMEELVSSFETMAGVGTGSSYTALTLHAMSKHFSTLQASIVSKIMATKRKMDKDLPEMSFGLGHNRASLQQIGLMHSPRQAWRPIRGLPETSVTLLRAWLFEHFLHPYPNDSDKLMLASQAGLSKNQVSNWFINARVRLWKPMIEEMYKEEFAESDQSAREGADLN